MEDSKIQELCRRIYEKHRRALDLLFENRPDRVSEISSFLLQLVEQSDRLLPDHSTKTYVRFWPRELDFLPKVGDGWTPSKRLLLFEFDGSSGGLNLKIVLGPGPKELRETLHAVIARSPDVFNKAGQRFYPVWWSCHIERWVNPKQYQDSDGEELRQQLTERFKHFVERDLPKMQERLQQLRSTLPMGDVAG